MINGTLESRLAAAVDEFLATSLQHRPDAEAFASRYPDLADHLRQVLPALALLEPSAFGPDESAGLTGTLGDFRLVCEVGRGGMGVVYEAEQISLGRRVALKVLPYAATMDAKQLQRFKNEARAAAGLKHEHIVQVFGVGCERGVHFYSMEFIDGQTLAQLIAGMTVAGAEDRAPIPDRTAVYVPTTSGADLRAADSASQTPDAPRATLSTADTAPIAAFSTERSGPKGRSFYRSAALLMAQAADALEHAHQLGIVHRDVKPGNLMVDTTGKLWVTDFGLARFGPDAGLTLSGDLLGTLRYMAPEQALSHHGLVDHRADVYALGATLYELLTGRPVVAAAERGEILRQIAFEEPTRLRKIDKSIPIELETITMKCLMKNPAERYTTAGALSEDLRRFLADQPIRARSAGPVERVRRWGRRHPALAAVYGLLVLVVVLGTAGGAAAWQWQVAEAARNVAEEARGQAVLALQGEQKAKTGEADAQKQRDEVRALNDQLQRTLYAAHMNLAQQALTAGGVERVQELLEQHRVKPGETDLRRFEWHYLNRIIHAELLILKGHTGVILSVAFSPDGKRLASASGGRDKTVRVWDALTGQELFTLKGHRDQVNSVIFSPDGKHLASASGGIEGVGEVKVWDAQTGEELLSFKGDSWSVAFSPDGRRLASASGGRENTVTLWELSSGQKYLTLKGGAISVAFSPDGTRLAASSQDNSLKVWDVQTGKELLALKGHTGWVRSVAFSPDGNCLASTSEDKTVKIWDAKTGKELLTRTGHADYVASVAFSPDGKRLASHFEDKTVRVWDAQTGKDLMTFNGHTELILRVAFSPDGKRLASSGGETVRVWDAQRGNPLILKGGVSSIASVGFSPDGKRIAAGSAGRYGRGPGQVMMWDAQTGQELLTLKGHANRVTGIAFSPDGNRIASGDVHLSSGGEVKLWDAQTGKELFALPFLGSGKAGNSSMPTNVAFSPDGKLLAAALPRVKLWDAQTGKERLAFEGFGGMLAFSPDGKRLGWGSHGNGAGVFDTQTGQKLLTIKGNGAVRSMAFSPDGKRMAGASADNTAKVWDVQTGEELLILKGHADWVSSVAYSPDGKRLASASNDKTVKVWDAETGQELLTVEGHAGDINGVAFSPDGHRLASGAADGTVKIFDATPLPEKR